MTKKVNKYFMVVAIVFIILSIGMPMIDYLITKGTILSKGAFTSGQEYTGAIIGLDSEGIIDIFQLSNFYDYFYTHYATVNQNSIMYKAIQNLSGIDFGKILTIETLNTQEVYFMWYILDKIIWLFIGYCIFVIPISMVDLFYKMIKKEVD